MKRPIVIFFAAITAALSATAEGAVPNCGPNQKTDCWQDGVLVIDSPAQTCSKPDTCACSKADTCATTDYYTEVQKHVIQLLSSNGSTARWDTVAFFNADFYALAAVAARKVALYRTQPSDVRNIGLENLPITGAVPNAVSPWKGYITIGSTADFGLYKPAPGVPPVGSAYYDLGQWPDPDPAGVPGLSRAYPANLCAPRSPCFVYNFDNGFNGYQLLAATTANLFGPGLLQWTPTNSACVLPTTLMVGAGNADGGSADGGSAPAVGMPCPEVVYPTVDSEAQNYVLNSLFSETRWRSWNSFLNLDTSLMGGVHWRENGNRTTQTAAPSPDWSASPPYQGTSFLRFHPLELWLMGFVPTSTQSVQNYVFVGPSDIESPPGTTAYSQTVGPGMGTKGDGDIVMYSRERLNSVGDGLLSPTALEATMGPRTPSFATAPHFLTQLWVVVRRPSSAGPDTDTTNARTIQLMTRWRKAWNAYFYMLTSYTGKVVTTPDLSYDDMAYWEFGQPADDKFVASGGITYDIPDRAQDTQSPAIITKLTISSTPGEAGTIKLANKNIPVRISGRQDVEGPIDTVIVRMRVPTSGPSQAKARIILDGGLTIDLPATLAPGAAPSYLVNDGQWHTYSASLYTNPDFVGKDFTSFTFVPSTAAFQANGGPTIDVDFVRFLSAGYFSNVKQDAKGARLADDDDVDCAGNPKPDGWSNGYDNCPKLYNPLQTDADQNGIGDDCEDFDFDGVQNACDNCPAISNSRQLNSSKTQLGDACNPDLKSSSCFLTPDSLAGRSPRKATPFVLGAIALLGLIVARRVRRR